MTFNVPGRVICIDRPDAPVFRKLYLSGVGHAGRHRNHGQLFGLRIEPHHRVAACAANPYRSGSTIDVDRIRYVVAFARKRILLPLLGLWIEAAEVAAAVARYPHNAIVCYFQAARAVNRRLPFSNLARDRVDNSNALAVELRIPDLTVGPDVYSVGITPAGLTHRRHVRSLRRF